MTQFSPNYKVWTISSIESLIVVDASVDTPLKRINK